MKATDEIKNVPITVFGFYLGVLYVAFTSLTWQSALYLIGVLCLHYLLKFTQIKQAQSKLLSDVEIHLKNLEGELLAQRTDISKLNLLFGINQNMTKNPQNAFMSPSLRGQVDEELNGQTAWTPKKKSG